MQLKLIKSMRKNVNTVALALPHIINDSNGKKTKLGIIIKYNKPSFLNIFSYHYLL